MNEKARARLAVGGLSTPSKMPCYSWSIPATKCDVGMKLAKVEGSVCSDCYALKGMYHMPNVKKAMARRLRSWKHDRVRWVSNFTKALEGETWFRWFDSGDLQGLEMLEDIAQVAARTPWCKHWLPTKEAWIVERFKRAQNIPSNLTIRLSLPMVGMRRPRKMDSTVLTSGVVVKGETCPAKKQGHKCLECRRCWSKGVKHVTYQAH